MQQPSTKQIRPTLRDVADAAGVTIATASRALSGAYGVHPETRIRVSELASKLDYKANISARSLVTGRSNLVGLIISDVRNSYFAEVARGAEDAAYAAGLDVLLCNSDLDSTRQMRYVNSLMEKRVDGIMMNSVASLTREERAYIADSGIPIVLLNRADHHSVFSTVTADNERGGRLAAEFLLAHGHRHLVHLTGPKNHDNLSKRAAGFVQAVQEYGRSSEASVIHGVHTLSGGYDMAKTLFRNLGKITAISTANDTVAFGAIKAAIEMGLKIPEDISIVGFDDVEVAAVVHPPLTTIRQSKYEIGAAAIEVLLRLSTGKDRTVEHRVLGVELIERKSVCTVHARK